MRRHILDFVLAVTICLGCSCRAKTQAVSPPPQPSLQNAQLHTPVEPPPRPPFVRRSLPRIDVHTHVLLGTSLRAARLFEQYGISLAVNLSGGPAGHGFEEFVVDSQVAYGHLVSFTSLDFEEATQPGYGARMVADLTAAKALGARGLKIPKGLGLGYVGPDQKPLKVDDPGLDVVFDKAGQLGLPVAIHVGDPQAFWQEPGPKNERFDELLAHPEWSFYDAHKRGEIPSWRELYDAFLRRVARHPKTQFIGVHFGNAPEDPDLVAQALDKYPNLFIDTAARLPAIGRSDANHSPEKLRAFFLKYQDRILFGTDTAIGRNGEAAMFGSVGTDPPTPADAERFFESTYRYFETADTDIPSPTPIQGKWTIAGINLPVPVLEKIYYKNAERLLGLSLPRPMPKREQGPAPTGDEL
ncbi:MAG: amidohydrolase family protein [Myxococcales bacterium]|nr:amidohydrolase family protein [Myxococcales bacterium]